MFDVLKRFFVSVNEAPVVIVGNQKSGTSAIAHLLAEHGGLSKTIDIPPLWPPVGVRIMHGETSFSEVLQKNPTYFATDLIKEPMMTFFLDEVLETFSDGTFIFVIRDPRANIRSLLDRRDLPGDRETLSESDQSHLRPESVVVDPDVWGGEETNYVGVLAHRWNRAADAYLNHKENLVLARYEEFMEGKQQFIEALGNRIGVPKQASIDHLVDRPFQPRGANRGCSWTEFFGPNNLRRIEEICGERMRRLDYKQSEDA